jgi:hypothetical protein
VKVQRPCALQGILVSLLTEPTFPPSGVLS